MNTLLNNPDWYTKFKNWIQQPSPTGGWVYRGQPAKYESIVPSLLRNQNRRFYRNQLHDIDYNIAERTLSTSPVFGQNRLFHHIITDEISIKFQDSIFCHGPMVHHPNIGFKEIVRSLAQHYGYPTLYIDLSISPIVSSFFATHTFFDGSFKVMDDEKGNLYRWPYVRKSEARLQIHLSKEKNCYEQEYIDAIDIGSIDKNMRRPHNQLAVLATPVSDPRPIYQQVPSSIDNLELIDMANVPSCECFEIPAGAGHELVTRENLSGDALFPDKVDLGFSYVSMIALLSLIIHKPEQDMDAVPADKNLIKNYNTGLSCGRSILDRECIRLVKDCPVPNSYHEHTLSDAFLEINHLSEIALLAIGELNSPEVKTAVQNYFRKKEEDTNKLYKELYEKYRKSVIDTLGHDRAVLDDKNDLPNYKIRLADNHDWIVPELYKRLNTIKSIIDSCEYIPIYALIQPENYDNYIDAFYSDSDYETMVKELIKTQELWLFEQEKFKLDK